MNEAHEPDDNPMQIVVVCDRPNDRHPRKFPRPRLATFGKVSGYPSPQFPFDGSVPDTEPESYWTSIKVSRHDRNDNVIELYGDTRNTWAEDTVQWEKAKAQQEQALTANAASNGTLDASQLMKLWVALNPAPVQAKPKDVRNGYRIECQWCRQHVDARAENLFAAFDRTLEHLPINADGAHEVTLGQVSAILKAMN